MMNDLKMNVQVSSTAFERLVAVSGCTPRAGRFLAVSSRWMRTGDRDVEQSIAWSGSPAFNWIGVPGGTVHWTASCFKVCCTKGLAGL